MPRLAFISYSSCYKFLMDVDTKVLSVFGLFLPGFAKIAMVSKLPPISEFFPQCSETQSSVSEKPKRSQFTI